MKSEPKYLACEESPVRAFYCWTFSFSFFFSLSESQRQPFKTMEPPLDPPLQQWSSNYIFVQFCNQARVHKLFFASYCSVCVGVVKLCSYYKTTIFNGTNWLAPMLLSNSCTYTCIYHLEYSHGTLLVSSPGPTLSRGKGSGEYWVNLSASLVVLCQQCWCLNKWMTISLWGSTISLASISSCMTLCYSGLELAILDWYGHSDDWWC